MYVNVCKNERGREIFFYSNSLYSCTGFSFTDVLSNECGMMFEAVMSG